MSKLSTYYRRSILNVTLLSCKTQFSTILIAFKCRRNATFKTNKFSKFKFKRKLNLTAHCKTKSDSKILCRYQNTGTQVFVLKLGFRKVDKVQKKKKKEILCNTTSKAVQWSTNKKQNKCLISFWCCASTWTTHHVHYQNVGTLQDTGRQDLDKLI